MKTKCSSELAVGGGRDMIALSGVVGGVVRCGRLGPKGE